LRTIIAKWGNSLGLRISKGLAEELRLTAGTEVQLTVEDGGLVARPTSPKRYALAELLEAMTPDNVHSEVDAGAPRGREIW
jgi:antitoxin MazE